MDAAGVLSAPASMLGSLGAWYEHRYPSLLRFAYVICGDTAVAEDLVQDALVRTFSRGRPETEIHRAEGYVRSAILSTYVDGFRRRRRWAAVRHLFAHDAERTQPGPERASPDRLDLRDEQAVRDAFNGIRRRLEAIMDADRMAAVRFVRGDITDAAQVRAALNESGARRVIHLAGLQVPSCRTDPAAGARVNVLGTLHLFEAARAASIERLVYASSAAVFGLADEAVDERPHLVAALAELATDDVDEVVRNIAEADERHRRMQERASLAALEAAESELERLRGSLGDARREADEHRNALAAARQELVAFADVNRTRMNVHNDRLAELGVEPVPTYDAADYLRMLEEQQVDVVVVTTVDRFHDMYIVEALDAGRDVVTEKPMTTDVPSAGKILDAVHRNDGNVTVTFNYRYNPIHEKVRELLADGAVGEIGSVHFEWLLDTRHGADYFRRWHRDKANSGGLMVHKATHHFDLLNWWVGSTPETVYAHGRLFFYGAENGERHGYTDDERFALKLEQNPWLKKL